MSAVYELADARALHAENPRSFKVPAPDEVDSLPPGRLAKLIFHPAEGVAGKPERMWVEVTAHDGEGYTGTLANQPVSLPMSHGDTVRFGAHHVIDTADWHES